MDDDSYVARDWHDPPQRLRDEGIARSSKRFLEWQKRRAGQPLPVTVPNWGDYDTDWEHYPHPLVIDRGEDTRMWGFDNADLPRALVELKMCAMSNEIREKQRWWEKMRDETIRAKRREEVKAHEEVEENVLWRLTPEMVGYVFQELEGYAAIRDPTTDIQLACFERVWRSDDLIAESLRQDLLASSALLESCLPLDWHPGSDGQVLDLVHPSLYPVVYGRTYAWHASDSQFKVLQPPKPLRGSLGTHLSKQFCWLPSDFSIAADGTSTLVSPYINNVDAQTHPSLNGIINSLVQAAVPLWDRVLASLVTPLSSYRIKQEGISFVGTRHYPNKVHCIRCLWKRGGAPFPKDPDMSTYDQVTDSWYQSQTDFMNPPYAVEAYDGRLEAAVKNSLETMEACKASLKGQTIQVIVKLANIVLTPEKPEYGYYDEENITKSSLSFRASTNQPVYPIQEDSFCMKTLYGMYRADACLQERGNVKTQQHRCIAFPNLYQHRVSPFSLMDRTKAGHRKIVALFLVDPTIYIPSATQIPPQQHHLYQREIVEENELFTRMMPTELREKVVGCLEGKMSREEAEDVRRRFMEERSQSADEYYSGEGSFFGIRFNMCEH